jgi:hypothetical protein
MKTVFIRVLAPPPEQKGENLRAAVASLRGSQSVYALDPSGFLRIPKSPFAYWVTDGMRSVFDRLGVFESTDRTVKVGIQTSDDFRFVRVWTEVPPHRAKARWFPLAKGGRFAPYYASIPAVLYWEDDGRIAKAWAGSLYDGSHWSRILKNVDHFFRPGLTWPLRGIRFSAHFVPSGCIFSVAGKMAFAPKDELPWFGALFNSSVFDSFIAFFAGKVGGVQYEAGLIRNVPVPEPPAADVARLGALGRRSFSIRRHLDSRNEISHAFLLPALVRHSSTDDLVSRANSWSAASEKSARELVEIDDAVNAKSFELYGVSEADQLSIVDGWDGAPESSTDDEEPNNDDEDSPEEPEVDVAPMVQSLMSWALGVAFGRFDVRLATGDRGAPPEPEPFDPLPVCSAGMLTGDDGLPVATPPSGYPLTFPTDGILVDDPGHPRDIVRAARAVFEAIFDDPNARWHEAAELLGTPDLRTWFARHFFEPHIKRYSRSRRKAPIYWQLATSSGSYSVWLYIHRVTGDTLFRVLNEFVGPKLDHEKTKRDALTQEAGANPSAAQRREIDQQETFVGELQALKTEVARVAPLWKLSLDDGVILTFATLWRLVPQSRTWQGECKKAWDKLVAGDYDWAQVAMHLWPERVVPKCIDDRSHAIAHGLEDVFWHQDDSGTWRKSRVDDAIVHKLIQERTSATVKAALKDLLSAATPTAGKRRKTKGRSASPLASASKPAPAAVRATTPDTPLDEATLRAVKAAIASVADGASKNDVLAATGLSEGDWNEAIAALLDRGDVTRTGQKRGTRYHAESPGEDG